MVEHLNLPLILIAAFISTAAPGTTTLAISGTSMNAGRESRLAVVAGVTSGSFLWSVSATRGLARS